MNYEWIWKTISENPIQQIERTVKNNRLTSGELLSNDGERLASSVARHGLVRLSLV